MSSTRFVELDGLRGLAAAAVVVGHFTTTFSEHYPTAPGSSIELQYGQFGVQLFFLISGFVILMTADRAKRASDFAISRFTRLYPAYWIAVVISIAVGALANVPGTQLTPLEMLLNFTMIQRLLLVPDVNGAFWTLAVEMQFYIIVFLVLLLTKCRLTDVLLRWLVAAWLAIAVASAVTAALFAPGVDITAAPVLVRAMVNVTLAEYGPLFCLGMLLFMARRNQRFEWLTIPAFLAVVVSAYLLHSSSYAAIVAGIGVFFTFVALRTSTPPLRLRPLLWLGKISYSLYIVHVVVGYATIDLLWPLIGRDLATLAATAVAVVLAWGLHAVAESRMSASWRRTLLQLRDKARDNLQ
ncbi:acyltransferase family protein [Pseudoclavibacter sp. VKM Ac-2867]|uniref:acyltransferase family protein n=1 Tax=Pseudoclavibacter sp. VKM Ac-2867 TaxID=2783829 RepID=UPI00188A8659|nr:acyltransferase [Pseudoclavibacter sp. VKM Ac-2867]MBF4457404.1 acyltransferase [Pseudoclavibacter sp. VKM Ac-2867]